MLLLTVDLFQISFMCTRTHIIIHYSEGIFLLTGDLFQISFMCSRTYKVKCVQLKNALLLQSFMKLFHSQHSHLRFYMVEQFQLRLVRIGTKRFLFILLGKVSCLSSYLLLLHNKNHT